MQEPDVARMSFEAEQELAPLSQGQVLSYLCDKLAEEHGAPEQQTCYSWRNWFRSTPVYLSRPTDCQYAPSESERKTFEI